MDWFLYDNGLRHERVKAHYQNFHENESKLESSFTRSMFSNNCNTTFLNTAIHFHSKCILKIKLYYRVSVLVSGKCKNWAFE